MKGEASAGPRAGTARIVVADDHELVRSGMLRTLANEPDLEVVGEAGNGREALGLCRRLRPDLVLMDVRMPEMDGLQATRAIKAELPSVAVLVVTTYENPDYLFEALKAGAAGYILKDAPKRQLLGSIRRVLDGEAPLNQELAAQLIRRLAEGADPTAQERRQQAGQPRQEPAVPPRPQGREAPPPLEALTPREVEVLQYLARGQTNPDIARTLSVSRGTVKVHVQHIIAKLGVSDRTQAAIRALDLGLIRPNRDF